jgi:hypothetical protein
MEVEKVKATMQIVRSVVEFIIDDSLENVFEFSPIELDYINSKENLIKLLPGIGRYIKHNFDTNARLVLELMDNGDDWQTLFINIHTASDFERSNKFLDKILTDTLPLFPFYNINFNMVHFKN